MNTVPDKVSVLNALLRKDLSSFIQQTFATVDPGTRYLHSWHIDAIAFELEKVAAGETTRLIITMPPRSLKSVAASVAFPAWLLGHNPQQKVVAVSYSETLAEKFALDCLKVLQASWYRAAFPATRIAKGKGARSDFETTRGGGRFSTSVSGTLTGRGGDIIIIDDPHKPEDATSDLRRQSVLDWYKSTLLSRLNDPVGGPIVLIQQRVHEEDLAGMLLEQEGWRHLDLQAIAEETHGIDLGWRGAVARKKGDLLHPDRLPHSLLERRRLELGSYVFAAQYQQRPAPLGGGMVKWEWFDTYDSAPERQGGDMIVQSWDTAITAEETSNYSVCTTWLVRQRRKSWLLDVRRSRLEYPELQRAVMEEAGKWRASLVLIEEAGSGIQLIQTLKSTGGLNVLGIKPRTDKKTRLMSGTPFIEAGKISIPVDATWLADFQRELVHFPRGKFDDQVDSLSQFLSWLGAPSKVGMVGRMC
ncbi:phage terminase large subunit [Sulfitobacter sp. JBTF-M27]|uniref:Phage terminase large subunit n=1 Tax=Sulfitobacter sediminilitoris TaxID=2698830 RepID=A0A6P0CJJ3_9RHOB|nr:phage terminase large subunit [Sulfitobacter sediminilitoris]NEK25155.1 phage terminase large subunit [Sulfitobacter sediminilitoris]